MESIGVRELRQNASKYLDLVKRGVSIEVTERGVPIAVLGPIPAGKKTRFEELVEQGILIPGKGNLREILDRPIAPIEPNYEGPTIAEILNDLREDIV